MTSQTQEGKYRRRVRALREHYDYVEHTTRVGDTMKIKPTEPFRPRDVGLGLPWPDELLLEANREYTLEVVKREDDRIYVQVVEIDEPAQMMTTVGKLAREEFTRAPTVWSDDDEQA